MHLEAIEAFDENRTADNGSSGSADSNADPGERVS
jgi:hypothetical protein